MVNLNELKNQNNSKYPLYVNIHTFEINNGKEMYYKCIANLSRDQCITCFQNRYHFKVTELLVRWTLFAKP